MTVLMISDTAVTAADISQVFERDYAELFAVIVKHTLLPDKVMAFHHSYKPPFFIDVAVQVNRVPDQLTGRIKTKYLNGGNAVIARYQGPYEQIGMAYLVLANWLKEHNKEAEGAPFEVYLNSPSEVADPFKLRTDVYQMIK